MVFRFFIGVVISSLWIGQAESVLSEVEQDQLIQQFAPVVVFHSKEQFFPVSMEFLAQNTTLRQEGQKDDVLQPGFHVDELGKYVGEEGSHYYLDFNGNRQLYNGLPLIDGEKGRREVNAPCYANIIEKQEGAVIYYAFVYAYNGPLPGLGVGSVGIGTHGGDIEYVYMHLKKHMDERYVLEKVFFAHHGSTRHGYYQDAQELTYYLDDDGVHHPVIFSARNSHASHYSAVPKFRLKTWDSLNQKGPKWWTHKTVVNVGDVALPDNQRPEGLRWIKTSVCIGQGGPNEFDWRKADKETHEAGQVSVSLSSKDHSDQYSKVFDLKGKILIRAPYIGWQVSGLDPNQPFRIQFDVKQKSCPLADAQVVYSNIVLTHENNIVFLPKGVLTNLYIANLNASKEVVDQGTSLTLTILSQEY